MMWGRDATGELYFRIDMYWPTWTLVILAVALAAGYLCNWHPGVRRLACCTAWAVALVPIGLAIFGLRLPG